MIKFNISRRNLIKSTEAFYVVTRNGRRVEDRDYSLQKDAEYRASKLHEMVKKYDPNTPNKIEIVYTSLPRKIY